MKIEMIGTDENAHKGAKIRVVGIGGGGNNAINNMIRSQLLSGVEFVAANTDMKALSTSLADTRIQLGTSLTKGLGAGANPEVGRNATLEDVEKLRQELEGSDMVFITAGMGGGTGTGGAPIVAQICKELDILTVAVVTKPFHFEGPVRLRQANEGISEMRKVVDSLITIPNDRLISLATKKAGFLEMLKKADDVLLYAVKGISDLIVAPGLIVLDFADVKTIMAEMGVALMGTGIASGESRAMEAAQRAISSPLLEDISIAGARALLLNITASSNLGFEEVIEASTLIQKEVHEEANIIWGTAIDESMGDELRVTVVATGINPKEEKVVVDLERLRPPSLQELKPERTEDRETPTFVRKGKEIDKYSPKRGKSPDYYFDEEELEVPTFIRKAAD
ncbi:MAG TPA: cell division protein FtsZ [Thermodesulfobacteriota bacterium]|nr:cell division protein FtsZ [Thermodesulfobacteriota bacterium]